MNCDRDYLERWNDPNYTSDYIFFTQDQSFDTKRYLDQLLVNSTSSVVDLGCGEAKVLADIAPEIGTGIGVDASGHMLASARRRLLAQEIHNVKLIHADFRMFDVGIEVADAVMSSYALHHIHDIDKRVVFRRIYETLRPGGVFSLEDDSFNFPRTELENRVPEIMVEWEEHFGPKAWQFMKTRLAGDDFENTSFLDDLKTMIKCSGLELISVLPYGLNGSEILASKPT